MSQTNAMINEGFYTLAQKKVVKEVPAPEYYDDDIFDKILPVIPKVKCLN